MVVGVRPPRSPVDVIESLLYAHSADLSPDGSRCAWAQSSIRHGAETFELSVREVGGASTRSIGAGRDPRWAPDGRLLAFLGDDEAGNAQIFLWDTASERVEKATSLAQGVVGGLSWSPDGSMLAFSAFPVPRDRTLPYRVTRVVGWRDGPGLVDDSTADVWVYDAATRVSRALTDDDSVNSSPTWLAQTGEIAFIASHRPDDWEGYSAVRAVSLEGVARDILEVRFVSSIADLPESIGQLAMTIGGTRHDTVGELAVLRHDGTLESRSAGLGLDVVGDVLADMPSPFADPAAHILVSGSVAIMRVQDQDRLTIHRLSLQGEQSHEVVASEQACLYPLALSGDSLLYARGDLLTAPDFWVRDLASGADHRVSDTAAHNVGVQCAVDVERFWARAGDGPEVQGKLMRPRGATGPLPTYLIIHGGPYCAYGEAFVTDAQLLCEAGFAVLLVNPRGSRGYGNDFTAAIRGDWGTADFDDLMAAVDHAVELGWADPDRLAVGGLSYGGYMAAWVIGHTHRFKAAVFENGVSNFWSMYGTSDIGLAYMAESFGASPHEDLDTYVRCSPITTAHTAVTPTLVILGDQDHRCPPEQGRQLYSVLRRAGCVAEMLVLPGASHGGSVAGSVAVRRAQNEALLEWLERHV